MHYIAHVRLNQFYVNALAAQDASTRTVPLIVHRDKAVLDANEPAMALGIHIGISLQEAKILLKGASGVAMAWQEDRFTEAQERWLDLCAELTDIVEPEFQHSAFLDLSAHANPVDLAEVLSRRLTERLGLRAHMGISRCKWVARLSSERLGELAYGTDWRLACREAIDDPARFLSPFSTECLLPVLPEHRRRLMFLGYRTIGEVVAIPSEVLRDQFGDHATLIRAAALGGADDEVKALYPKDRLIVSLSFEGGAESSETLGNGFVLLAERLGKALERRDAYGAHVEALLEFESGRAETRKRRFAKPIVNARSALMALRLLIGESHPEAISRVRVTIADLRNAQRSQPKLTGETSSSARPTNLENAFSAIRTVFGDKAIQSAGEIVLPRRVRVLKAWKEATGWV